MSLKRDALEVCLWLAARLTGSPASPPARPSSIFVLRNGDIGDLIVITPLFQALRERFPEARIVAGVGNWNVPVLAGNPFVSEVVALNAPWHNKFVAGQTTGSALRYVFFSDEARALSASRHSIGIDILGSTLGSLLLLRAGIPYRLGVRGFGGGNTAAQQCITYNSREHVGRAALRFAELLGVAEADLPEPVGQIYLSAAERESGEALWSRESAGRGKKRIVLAPGGGFPQKCWPLESYVALAAMMQALPDISVAVVGDGADRESGARLAAAGEHMRDLTGALGLRETFALVASADLVVCNSSMVMHAAAAFRVPQVVLLGEYFASASQHAAQWAYADLSRVLGREAGGRGLAGVGEAFSAVSAYLSGPLPLGKEGLE